jgi:hypothetical protein
MNEPIMEMALIVIVMGFVFSMGIWAENSFYQHNTREGTILCEGTKSIVYNNEVYCLKEVKNEHQINNKL